MSPEPAANSAAIASASKKDVGRFVDLPGAEEGKVITRFPPEASGFLHIGHAKAALLNDYYAKIFKGTLLMRFDDTNPSKEKEDFEHVILDDLKRLEVHYDKLSYTSDHFDKLLLLCEQLISKGLAYVDDTDPETMKAERETKTESKNRNNSVDKNMQMWAAMKDATSVGTTCAVRAKIDMSSPNGCLRDPTIYRCKAEVHPRTKDKYKVYPTYDFACPIVDSVEGVTHALRTTEYFDRDAQYYWFIDKLELRKPYIYSYGRLCMMNTVLSKRKLAWFVEQGLVSGWDDPRFPTVRGILRHGMTVEGLKNFIIAQGSSRNVIQMEWDKIWAFNKKVIDPVVPRFSSVLSDGYVVVNVEGAQDETKDVALHPKNEAIGMKRVRYGPQIIIDYVDAETIREGEMVTFINWGNLFISSISRDEQGRIKSISATMQLDNTDYKKTTKLTWLAPPPSSNNNVGETLTPCVLVYYDHIISKPILGKDEDFKAFINYENKFEIPMLAEYDVRGLKQGDIVQLQRRGFFICDQPYASVDPLTGRSHRPCVLFFVPDGHNSKSLKQLLPSYGGLAQQAPEKNQNAEVQTVASSITTEELTCTAADSSKSVGIDILRSIKQQGDAIRQMKEQKAAKEVIKAELDKLVALKKEYKAVSGKEWSVEQNALV